MVDNALKRTPAVVATYFYLLWRKWIEYRVNAISDFIVRLADAAFFFILWFVILDNTNSQFFGWDWRGFLLIYAMEAIFIGVMVSFGYAGMDISKKIVEGKLDPFLARPTYAWLNALLERSNFEVMGIIYGFIALTIALLIGIDIPPAKMIVMLAMVAMGCLIAILFFLTIGCLSFWFGRVNALHALANSFWQFQAYPSTIFNRSIQVLIAFTFPFIFIQTIPVLWILEKITFAELLPYLVSEVIILSIWIITFLTIWKKGVKRYESFGG